MAATATRSFSRRFLRSLEMSRIGRRIRTEKDLEQNFVMPAARRAARHDSKVWLCVHPWSKPHSCAPTCKVAHKDGQAVFGCRRCWKDSKKWSAVAAIGAHHNFDLVAKEKGKTLAVEIKFLRAKGGRMSSGAIQRFVGQCSLAAARHRFVIGVLGYHGIVNKKWNRDTKKVRTLARRLGIHLVVRRVP